MCVTVVVMAGASSRLLAQSYWTIDSSAVNQVLFQSSGAGYGYSYSAGAGGGTCDAVSTNANTGGVTVEFRVQWSFHFNGSPYFQVQMNVAADLDGSGAAGGWSEAGYSYTPYVSIYRNTTSDGNPFSRDEDRGPYTQSTTSGLIVASAKARATASGGESTATSFAHFRIVNNPQ